MSSLISFRVNLRNLRVYEVPSDHEAGPIGSTLFVEANVDEDASGGSFVWRSDPAHYNSDAFFDDDFHFTYRMKPTPAEGNRALRTTAEQLAQQLQQRRLTLTLFSERPESAFDDDGGKQKRIAIGQATVDLQQLMCGPVHHDLALRREVHAADEDRQNLSFSMHVDTVGGSEAQPIGLTSPDTPTAGDEDLQLPVARLRKKGFLFRLGQKMKAWKRRLFVIDYLDDTGTQPGTQQSGRYYLLSYTEEVLDSLRPDRKREKVDAKQYMVLVWKLALDDIVECAAVHSMVHSKNNCFYFTTKDAGETKTMLSAATAADREEWLITIANCRNNKQQPLPAKSDSWPSSKSNFPGTAHLSVGVSAPSQAEGSSVAQESSKRPDLMQQESLLVETVGRIRFDLHAVQRAPYQVNIEDVVVVALDGGGSVPSDWKADVASGVNVDLEYSLPFHNVACRVGLGAEPMRHFGKLGALHFLGVFTDSLMLTLHFRVLVDERQTAIGTVALECRSVVTQTTERFHCLLHAAGKLVGSVSGGVSVHCELPIICQMSSGFRSERGVFNGHRSSLEVPVASDCDAWRHSSNDRHLILMQSASRVSQKLSDLTRHYKEADDQLALSQDLQLILCYFSMSGMDGLGEIGASIRTSVRRFVRRLVVEALPAFLRDSLEAQMSQMTKKRGVLSDTMGALSRCFMFAGFPFESTWLRAVLATFKEMAHDFFGSVYQAGSRKEEDWIDMNAFVALVKDMNVFEDTILQELRTYESGLLLPPCERLELQVLINPVVNRWLARAHYMFEDCLVRILKMDDLDVVDPTLRVSSSVVDLLSMFAQVINKYFSIPLPLVHTQFTSLLHSINSVLCIYCKELVGGYQSTDHRGWLEVRGGRLHAWKRMWFVLRSDSLFYFRSDTDKIPLACVGFGASASVQPIGKQRRSSLAVLTRERSQSLGSSFRFELHDCSLGEFENETTEYKVGCPSKKEMDEWITLLGRALAARQKAAAQKSAVDDWGADALEQPVGGSAANLYTRCNNVFFAWESILQLETRVAELREEHAVKSKDDAASENAREQSVVKRRLGLWSAAEDGLFAPSVCLLERQLIALITAICDRLVAASVQPIVERAYAADPEVRGQLATKAMPKLQGDAQLLAKAMHPSCWPLCVAGLQISVCVAFLPSSALRL